MTVLLAAVVAVLFSVGTYLVLQRTLTRVILGLGAMGHGANLLLLASGGRAGTPPLVAEGDQAVIVGAGGAFVDPLPQALALTAIVISLAVTAFLLALAYRSWQLHEEDDVPFELEDRRQSRLAEADVDEPAEGASRPVGGA